MRKSLIFTCLLLGMALFPHCVEEENTATTGQGWSSSDPASIPLRQRIMQSERGNLVRNPSFEYGRIINVDNNVQSSNITAWTMVGENVTWVFDSIGTGSTRDEIHTGNYSIKVYRNHDESHRDRREGIVSDFIKVIPGSYDLSYWIRLSDIRPPWVSRGRRMNVGVDIRVQFFDKNRLLLGEGTAEGQDSDGHLNKSLAFSDFWNIDSLGWTSVKGRTGFNFFTEGDIPDETRFVKIFLGLRGTGTMWIDDVDFRYGRRNFTSLERTSHLLDTTLADLDLIIPTPRHIEALEPFNFHMEGSDTIPLPQIQVPYRSEKQTLAAANLLKTSLDSLFAKRLGRESLPGIKIIRGSGTAEEGGLIFRLGERNLASGLEDPQGYIIGSDTLNPGLIHLSGTTARGDYYAAATAVQMLDDSLWVFHRANITDYPDIPQRAFLVSPVAAASNTIDYQPYFTEMASLKLNWAYLDYYRSKTLWEQASPAYLKGLQIVGEENRSEGMLSLAQMVNPYAFMPQHPMLDSLGREIRERWSHSSSASMEKLKQQFLAGMKAGASTLVLCSDDYLPLSPEGNYLLYSEQDRAKYINLQEAQLEMINSVYFWSRQLNPGIEIEFIPPWYYNSELGLSRGQAEQYFMDMKSKLPEDMKLIWAGPAQRSHDINAVDYKRYHDITGRDLLLMDNTMGSLAEISFDTLEMKDNAMKLRSLNLFDPFAVEFSEPFGLAEAEGKLLVNSSLSSEIMKIRIATAADFMWNTGAYDPDLSLYKVLVSRFGKAVCKELYIFSDSYYTALGSIISLRNGKDHQKLIRQIYDQLILMEESLVGLSGLLELEPGLLNELKDLKQSLESLYDRELKTVASQIIASLKSM